jgi:hypothetical protein
MQQLQLGKKLCKQLGTWNTSSFGRLTKAVQGSTYLARQISCTMPTQAVQRTAHITCPASSTGCTKDRRRYKAVHGSTGPISQHTVWLATCCRMPDKMCTSQATARGSTRQYILYSCTAQCLIRHSSAGKHRRSTHSKTVHDPTWKTAQGEVFTHNVKHSTAVISCKSCQLFTCLLTTLTCTGKGQCNPAIQTNPATHLVLAEMQQVALL